MVTNADGSACGGGSLVDVRRMHAVSIHIAWSRCNENRFMTMSDDEDMQNKVL